MRSLKLFALFFCVSIAAFGQQRRFITFQGRLLQASQPFNPSGGTTNITFNIPSAGWTEQHLNVPVINGYYAVVLGQRSTPVGIDASLFRDSVKRRLNVRIGGSIVEAVDLYAPIESDPTVPAWVRDANPWAGIPGRPRTIDTSNTNENQTLVINGSNLTIQPNGNTVTLPSGSGIANGTIYGAFNVVDSTCRTVVQNSSTGGSEISNNRFWQSFLTPLSGRICAVQFSFSTPANVNSVNIRIFAGQGNATTPIEIFNGLVVSSGTSVTAKTLQLPRTVPINSGAIYTVEISAPAGTNIGVSVTNDNYSGGTSDQANRDLAFGVSVRGTSNPNLVVDGQGVIGIGTTPTNNSRFPSRLQVDGRIFDVTGALTPVGSVQAFAGDSTQIPPGWLLCNGNAVSRTIYPDLFRAISTNWGSGDGVGTFNIPDLRGYFLRGWTNNTQRDPDNSSRFYGADSLSQPPIGAKIGSYQNQQLIRHTHKQKTNEVQGTQYGIELAGNTSNLRSDGTPNYNDINGLLQSVGGSETRPRNAYVHYIIKY